MSPVFRRDSEVCVGAKGSGTFYVANQIIGLSFSIV